MDGEGALREASEALKAMAHPVRLTILGRLRKGVLCVSEMKDLVGAAQPYISQHLSVLRKAGLVDYFVDGKQRCYFLKDPRALAVLDAFGGKKKPRPLPPPACCPSGGKRTRSGGSHG